jgi:riboflavin kinase/FMN adenylyltransferase
MSRDIKWFGEPIEGGTVAIGIFDGVHLGHQGILDIANEFGDPVTVLTFDPHPTSIFAPDRTPTKLLNLENRVHQLMLHGAEAVAVLEFTGEFATLLPEQFIEEILVGKLKAKHIVVGENFTFGANAAGDVNYLRSVSEKYGFSVTGVDLVEHEHGIVSSTRIRKHLLNGGVEIARELLTRPHQLIGPVIHGEARGREIGYPTANIEVAPNSTIPSDGVYAGWLTVGLNRWPAAISIGTNPTFAGVRGRQVEAYALDRDDLDLYGEEAIIEFGWRLRDTLKFDGLDPLLIQMKKDCDKARDLTSLRGLE